jgi:SAM-dependent methyltransferase
MMKILYDYDTKLHTVAGAKAVLQEAFSAGVPQRLLDVGCGTGSWLKAATELGVTFVRGLDGTAAPIEQLEVTKEKIEILDLSQPFQTGLEFDVALCLEVGEHLPEESSVSLVRSLAAHANVVLFSAACPGQLGQSHVNCQWPAYWQRLFNDVGFACDDSIRWNIWDDPRVEPWYRQNIFLARRDPNAAGHEPRLRAVIHPRMHSLMLDEAERKLDRYERQIDQGMMHWVWYIRTSLKAAVSKANRRLRR